LKFEVCLELEILSFEIFQPMRRLDQLLANLGYCSRSGARAFLKTHSVTRRATGAVLRDGAEKVSAAEVSIDGEPADHPDGILVALNKPAGLVCSHDPREGPGVYSLLPARWLARNPRVTSVGRLDKETSGLILLTDQAALVHRLTSPRHKVPKVYRATLDKPPPPEAAAAFASGALMLDGEKKPCAPARLRVIETGANATAAEVTLTEGRHHQVRRMFASQGCAVLALRREKFGGLDLAGIEPGKFRELPLDYFG
jgi:16S rRNA pseudouridine516 synthase